MEGKVGKRKGRSDKKVDVKPTMSLTLKRQLYDFADLCNEPVKDIAERLCIQGMVSRNIIEEICKWFRRDYRYDNTIALGYIERPRLKLKPQGETGKVTMRLKPNDNDRLQDLAYALDLTPTSTAAVLIRVTFKNMEFMTRFVEELKKVNEAERAEVRQFIARVTR